MRISTIAALALLSATARAQVTVSVDAAAGVHPISPLIYGMNFLDAARAQAAPIPLTRWGGNATSRYNYEIDTSNTAADYFFENVPGCWNAGDNWCATPPADPKAQSGANAFLAAAAQLRIAALFNIPTIGWVAKPPPKYAHPFDCGCPRTLVPQQDQFDPYDSNCGDCKSGGQWIAPPPATTTSVAVDATWAGAWVAYLVQRFGADAGQRIYELDNEPALWSSTHHDVRPDRLGYDELWQRMRDTAVAILDADPTAEVAGPVEWGWPNYFCSDLDVVANGCSAASPDRAAHGGEELVAWLLDQARAYERQNGRRILHYLDLHYYPQGGDPPAITRSLWDPTYVDPSWIGDTIRLIPRMRDWAAQHYPGTKLAISEYDFGHHDEPLGAITYAEVLGIFGREGLDAATAWAPPAANEAAFGAWSLYLDYDGHGSGFGATSVQAQVAGAGVQAYAATDPGRLTLVLVNEGGADATARVRLAGFAPAAAAEWYTGAGTAIARQPDVAVAGGEATVTLAGTSFGLLVFRGAGGPDLGAPVDGAAPMDLARSSDRGAPAADGAPWTGTATGGCGCAIGSAPCAPSTAIALLLALASLALRRRPRRD